MFNKETLEKIIFNYSDDKELLDMVYDAIKSFEEYHSAIYEMESRMKVYSYKNMSKEDYQDMVSTLDNRRTMLHNTVLTSVNVLNRMAVKLELPPVYDGIVSEERPYRREVANAVLSYVEEVIAKRR